MMKHLQIKDLFELFYDDDSGEIDLTELITMIKTNGIDLTDDEIERLFNLVDDDKSGCLSFDEFEQFMMN